MDNPSYRLSFPDDEARFPWLALLLNAYAIVDEGIAAAAQQKDKGIACSKGCAVCCRILNDIPAYPIELVGIYWHSVEKIESPARDKLKANLLNHAPGSPCPFLIESSCSVYHVRPMSCRQFNVLGKPCAENEDPYHTRKKDVLMPLEKYTDRAFMATLPFYGVINEKDKQRVIKDRLIHTQARILQKCEWKELAKRMDDFDSKNQKS
jgi:Fe-S-cluster containining protein